MDPNALDTGVTLPLEFDTLPIPLVGPRILQLSPIPGNIYKSDCFFYDHTADISQGDFRAVLAFASAHCHPAVVHQFPNIQAFQVGHPSAIVRPLSEVPPAILAWGWFLLSGGITLAPPAVRPAPAPPAAKQFGILPVPSTVDIQALFAPWTPINDEQDICKPSWNQNCMRSFCLSKICSWIPEGDFLFPVLFS
jgi:hypothetical protein